MDMVSFSNDLVSDVKLSPGDESFGGFAIVINGHSLVSVLEYGGRRWEGVDSIMSHFDYFKDLNILSYLNYNANK